MFTRHRFTSRNHRRIRRRRAASSRRLVVVLLLVISVAAGAGIPVLPKFVKRSSEPFPCQDCPCSCDSADNCWRNCCCFTMEEKLAWAKRNGVRPPQFILDQLARSGCKFDESHKTGTCCHEAECPKGEAECPKGTCCKKTCCGETCPRECGNSCGEACPLACSRDQQCRKSCCPKQPAAHCCQATRPVATSSCCQSKGAVCSAQNGKSSRRCCSTRGAEPGAKYVTILAERRCKRLSSFLLAIYQFMPDLDLLATLRPSLLDEVGIPPAQLYQSVSYLPPLPPPKPLG